MANAPSWDRIKRVFQGALDRPSHERAAWLQQMCGEDRALQAEVESLLITHEKAGSFAERPAIELLGELSVEGESRMSGPIERTVHPGDLLGVYEIQSLLGAGGMGEVYRARDTQLGRDVAIKVLPAAFVTDRERLARFEREARLLAALNHPHIGAIYGIEHVDGVRALVLELVEGATLADRTARGAMSAADVLPIARQIADALEAAHGKGIVHRDLKPANIKITPGGSVKVLDFGLAKMGATDAPDLSQSPTGTISGAHDGVLLGTVAYMSPEQARGHPVDKRADIWAFGCVLHEMLTGRAAFSGETVFDQIAAILEREPDWSALPAATPPAVQRMLRRCLEKDVERRLHDIADARIEIDDALTGKVSSATMRPIALSGRAGRIGWAVAALAVIAAALAGWSGARFASRDRPVARAVTRFVVQPAGSDQGFDISADGSLFVYVVGQFRTSRLFLRRLDQFDAVALAGTDSADLPFFSPDGQWAGFGADHKLKKVSVSGAAPPIVLCEAPDFLGATWPTNGSIIFATINRGLRRVSAEGGEPEAVTTIDANRHEIDHHDPELLPGGQALLFTIHEGEERFSIAVQSLASGRRKVLIDSGFDATYSPSGHLVYARGSAILAVPFDMHRLEVTGAAVTLVEHVATRPADGVGNFRLSKNGSLAFQPEPSLAGRMLTWVDRSGAETPLPIAPRSFTNPRVSPDGKQLAFAVADGDRQDIWTYDLAADKLTRVTRVSTNRAPLWTRDGRRLIYTSSDRAGTQQLMWLRADGNGTPESLLTSRDMLWPAAWTPDDRALLYVDEPPTDDFRVFVLPFDRERPMQPSIHAPVLEKDPSLSPDGQWLALTSHQTGRAEVYVEGFPVRGLLRQVSIDGGHAGMWSRSGRELFYRSGPRMFAVPVDTTNSFSAGKPVALFEGPYIVDFLDYDVAPDGRFLMIKPSEEEQAPARLNVVLNWVDELVRRVPSGK